MTSVLNKPIVLSASAFSYESPTLPTDGSNPASANRLVYFIARYCSRDYQKILRQHDFMVSPLMHVNMHCRAVNER